MKTILITISILLFFSISANAERSHLEREALLDYCYYRIAIPAGDEEFNRCFNSRLNSVYERYKYFSSRRTKNKKRYCDRKAEEFQRWQFRVCRWQLGI